MLKKLRELYHRHGDLLRYVVIGAATTGIDLIFFALFHTALGIGYAVAKVLTWVVAVTFAFCGNKWVVFRTKGTDGRTLLGEAVRFFAMRVVTLVLSVLLLYLFIDLWGMESNLANLIDNVVVIVLNYVLSKLFVFTK